MHQEQDRGYSRLWSFVLQDLEGTVHCVFVAVGLQTLQKSKSVLKMAELVSNKIITGGAFSYLHPSLHHIQRRISKDTGSSRRRTKHRRDNRVHFSPGVVTLEAKVGFTESGRKLIINQLHGKED